jgi:hypothetical protein
MIFVPTSSLNEDSLNIPETELNSEDLSNLYKINDICNPRLSLNLDENENLVENEDEKIYFIPKKIIYRYKNLSHIFRIQSAKKKERAKKT